MRKPGKLLFIVASVAVAVAGVAIAAHEDEPRYQGRSMSEWFLVYYESDRPNRHEYRAEATSAICAIGTNGVPKLLEWLQYETPPWHRGVAHALGVLPRPLALRIGNSPPARATLYRGFHQAAAAEQSLLLLGTNAASAVSDLRSMAAEQSHPQTAARANRVLNRLGSPRF